MAEMEQYVVIEVQAVAVEEEEGEIDTESAVGEVYFRARSEVEKLEGFTVGEEEGEPRTRGFEWFEMVAQNAVANKEVLVALFGAAAAAVNVLGKQGKVKKVELETKAGDKITVEETDKATAEALIEQFKEEHPGKLEKVEEEGKIIVRGKVSGQSKVKSQKSKGK